MTFSPNQVKVTPMAAPVWGGRSPGATVLLYNPDPSNTVYVSGNSGITVGASNTMPLGPGQSAVLDGSDSIYACAPTGTKALVVVPGGSSFFQPTSLSSLGGISVFIQSAAPTGSIPVNSIWLQESAGIVTGFWTWSGTAWVAQTFNASEVLAVGTVVANLIAAGTIVAGIVNGTTITGAQIVADGASGEFLAYSAAPATGNLVSSISAVAGTDGHANAYKAGHTVYDPASTSYVQLVAASPAEANVGTGDTAEAIPGRITSQVSGSGTGRFIQTSVAAAHMTGQSANAGADCQVLSPNAGLTTPPTATLVASDGTSFCEVAVLPTVIQLAGPVSATQGTAADPTLITTDTWHPITMVTGWSTIAGSPVPSYRLLPDGNIQLSGVASFSSAFTTATSFAAAGAVPSPLTTQRIPQAGSNAWPQVAVNGAITAEPTASTTVIVLNGIYPTNL